MRSGEDRNRDLQKAREKEIERETLMSWQKGEGECQKKKERVEEKKRLCHSFFSKIEKGMESEAERKRKRKEKRRE